MQTHTCTHSCIHTRQTHTHTCKPTTTYSYTHMTKYTHKGTGGNTSVHTLTYTDMHTHTGASTHMHTCTRTHTQTKTHLCNTGSPCSPLRSWVGRRSRRSRVCRGRGPTSSPWSEDNRQAGQRGGPTDGWGAERSEWSPAPAVRTTLHRRAPHQTALWLNQLKVKDKHSTKHKQAECACFVLLSCRRCSGPLTPHPREGAYFGE